LSKLHYARSMKGIRTAQQNGGKKKGKTKEVGGMALASELQGKKSKTKKHAREVGQGEGKKWCKEQGITKYEW